MRCTPVTYLFYFTEDEEPKKLSHHQRQRLYKRKLKSQNAAQRKKAKLEGKCFHTSEY